MMAYFPRVGKNLIATLILLVTLTALGETADAQVPQTFDILFTEYQIDGELDFSMKPDWIVASVLESKTKKDGKVKSSESIRMIALEGSDTEIDCTKQVLMNSGATDQAKPAFIRYGKVVRFAAAIEGEEIVAKINYSSSKPAETKGEQGNGIPSEINFDIQTTVTLTPGKALMIGGRAGEQSTIVVVTLE